jgi:hypothetical protein
MVWENTSTNPPTLNRRNLANNQWIPDGLGETTNRGFIAAANPTMTGTVTVPTVATTSNTTVAASTAFVVSRLQVHGTAWIAATLLNGWTGAAFYRLNNNNTVSLRGVVVKTSSTTADVILTLPTGFRPTLGEYNDYNSVIGASVATRTTVDTNGNVTLNAGTALSSTFVSLDRVTFPLA